MIIKKPVVAALCACALATPSAAIACDLDGFGGLHRFNPFAAGQRMGDLPAPAPAKAEKTEKKQDAEKQQSAQGEGEKAEKKSAGKQPLPKRSWEKDEGNGPISYEDMATFT